MTLAMIPEKPDVDILAEIVLVSSRIGTLAELSCKADGARRGAETAAELGALAPLLDEIARAVQDLTVRLAATRALHASAAEKAVLLESMKNVLLEFVGPDMRVQWCNSSAREHYHLEDEDIRGRLCHEVFRRRDSPCPGCPVVRSLEARAPAESEMPGPRASRWAATATPIFDEKGSIRGVILAAIGLTALNGRDGTAGEDLHRQGTLLAENREPAMNVVSPDFDLLVVNPANATLVGKPVAALIGKKCYMEFEQRDGVCPYCPGVIALATGKPHEAETEGFRTDGSRFYARVRAQPVQGPNGRSAGFIEMVEDITQRKRAERLAAIQTKLQLALAEVSSPSGALERALDVALLLEDIDSGCAFMNDPRANEMRLVARKGLSKECLEAIAHLSPVAGFLEPPTRYGDPRAIVVVPITREGRLTAALYLGSSTQTRVESTTRAALESLGTQVGNTLTRIGAERAEKEASSTLKALIAVSPTAICVLDYRGVVTAWNGGSESMFGWTEAEARNHRPLFAIPDDPRWKELNSLRRTGSTARSYRLECLCKDGSRVTASVSTIPFHAPASGHLSSLLILERTGA